MHVLLFGGTGFIGEYLQKKLQHNKNYKIVVVGRAGNLDYSAEVIVILTQAGILSEILLPNIYKFKNLKKILYLSTTLLYPESKNKQDENILPDPQTEYEKNKYKEELQLLTESKKRGFYLCIARLSNVYGDIKNKGIINRIFLSLMEKNKDLVINGDPKSKVRDYIFVEDVVNILEFLIFYDQKKLKEIFNICTAQGTSLQQLLGRVEVITGKKVIYRMGEKILEKKVNIGDNGKILRVSGYRFKYNLIEGLNKTYRNYSKFYLV